MPIYEYVCEKCHHEFEELVFGGDTPACPACRASKTHKLMSRPQRTGRKSRQHSGGGDYDYGGDYDSGGGGGHSACVGCSGGNCATCH